MSDHKNTPSPRYVRGPNHPVPSVPEALRRLEYAASILCNHDNAHGHRRAASDWSRLHAAVEDARHAFASGATDEVAGLPPLNALAAEINDVNRQNGWSVTTPDVWPDQVHRLGTILALVHSEVSEALEAVRHRDRANFEEELADVMIRVLDLAGGLGVDMDSVLRAKLEANRARGWRHGGKAV